MAETYENACAGCQEKLKSELKDIAGELSDAVYETSSEISRVFCIGTAYGKLLGVIGNMSYKEDGDTE